MLLVKLKEVTWPAPRLTTGDKIVLWALSPSAAYWYLQNPLCLYLSTYKSRVHSPELCLHSVSNPHLLKGRGNRVQSSLVLYYYIQFFTSITCLLSISALYSQLHPSFLLVSFFAQLIARSLCSFYVLFTYLLNYKYKPAIYSLNCFLVITDFKI